MCLGQRFDQKAGRNNVGHVTSAFPDCNDSQRLWMPPSLASLGNDLGKKITWKYWKEYCPHFPLHFPVNLLYQRNFTVILAFPCCGCFVTIPFRQPKRLSRYGGHSHIGVPYFCKSWNNTPWNKWTKNRGNGWLLTTVKQHYKCTYRERDLFIYLYILYLLVLYNPKN